MNTPNRYWYCIKTHIHKFVLRTEFPSYNQFTLSYLLTYSRCYFVLSVYFFFYRHTCALSTYTFLGIQILADNTNITTNEETWTINEADNTSRMLFADLLDGHKLRGMWQERAIPSGGTSHLRRVSPSSDPPAGSCWNAAA